MICLHCGYCCTELLVVIIDNPELGIIDGNLKGKEDGRCQHLDENNMCKVHNYPWYKETPCFAHTQIEHGNTKCRIGEYRLKIKNLNL